MAQGLSRRTNGSGGLAITPAVVVAGPSGVPHPS
jgi:hypothetical protein